MPGRLDIQLIVDYLKGDEEALAILFGRYLKPVYSFVYRFAGGAAEADDITQEVFIKVWRNLKKFDQQKNFKTWLFAIAKHAGLDSLKKKRAIPFSEFETDDGENNFVDSLSDPAPLPDKLFEQSELGEALAGALNKLNHGCRMVLFLRYNDHFSFREIAESLGEPLDTVKSRHRRALIKLKELL